MLRRARSALPFFSPPPEGPKSRENLEEKCARPCHARLAYGPAGQAHAVGHGQCPWDMTDVGQARRWSPNHLPQVVGLGSDVVPKPTTKARRAGLLSGQARGGRGSQVIRGKSIRRLRPPTIPRRQVAASNAANPNTHRLAGVGEAEGDEQQAGCSSSAACCSSSSSASSSAAQQLLRSSMPPRRGQCLPASVCL